MILAIGGVTTPCSVDVAFIIIVQQIAQSTLGNCRIAVYVAFGIAVVYLQRYSIRFRSCYIGNVGYERTKVLDECCEYGEFGRFLGHQSHLLFQSCNCSVKGSSGCLHLCSCGTVVIDINSVEQYIVLFCCKSIGKLCTVVLINQIGRSTNLVEFELRHSPKSRSGSVAIEAQETIWCIRIYFGRGPFMA